MIYILSVFLFKRTCMSRWNPHLCHIQPKKAECNLMYTLLIQYDSSYGTWLRLLASILVFLTLQFLLFSLFFLLCLFPVNPVGDSYARFVQTAHLAV
jgi:hypothetical protein